jgi:sec-independent protein translocase protein TatC
VVNLIVAAIITPPDVTSQILVSLPILLLYEVSILVAARAEKRTA